MFKRESVNVGEGLDSLRSLLLGNGFKCDAIEGDSFIIFHESGVLSSVSITNGVFSVHCGVLLVHLGKVVCIESADDVNGVNIVSGSQSVFMGV